MPALWKMRKVEKFLFFNIHLFVFGIKAKHSTTNENTATDIRYCGRKTLKKFQSQWFAKAKTNVKKLLLNPTYLFTSGLKKYTAS